MPLWKIVLFNGDYVLFLAVGAEITNDTKITYILPGHKGNKTYELIFSKKIQSLEKITD